MEFKDGYNSAWLDRMMEIYNRTEMKRSDSSKVDLGFKNSFAVVSCWIDGSLVGIGRMISDGAMYSSIFDVVVDPSLQGRGIGKAIMLALIAKTPKATIHLTSTLGNEQFYFKLGFRRHRTAMSLYPESSHPSQYLDYEWQGAQ